MTYFSLAQNKWLNAPHNLRIYFALSFAMVFFYVLIQPFIPNSVLASIWYFIGFNAFGAYIFPCAVSGLMIWNKSKTNSKRLRWVLIFYNFAMFIINIAFHSSGEQATIYGKIKTDWIFAIILPILTLLIFLSKTFENFMNENE